jgi:hypothetical protein
MKENEYMAIGVSNRRNAEGRPLCNLAWPANDWTSELSSVQDACRRLDGETGRRPRITGRLFDRTSVLGLHEGADAYTTHMSRVGSEEEKALCAHTTRAGARIRCERASSLLRRKAEWPTHFFFLWSSIAGSKERFV